MRILQLCHKVPFPPVDGGCIAMNNLTQGLINNGNEVKVLAINTQKHFVDILKLSQEYRNKTNIEVVFVDTRVKMLPALFNLFSTKSYNIQRFYSKQFEQKLIELLNENTYDVVQLESLYVTMYAEAIKKYSKAKIVLRAHNVEYQIWNRVATTTKNTLKKTYLKLLAKRLKAYELSNFSYLDAIASITQQDEMSFKELGFLKPIASFPFGINRAEYNNELKIKCEPNSLFHIGAMDWQPNVDGLIWFVDNVFPLVLKKYQSIKLYIAGRKMPKHIQQLATENIIVMNEVANAKEFMLSKKIMLVPLQSGGGMRVKIIEGMALGKTIISTSIGAEGIDYTNEKNILIADTPKLFADAIAKCVENIAFAEKIAANAQELISKKYDNKIICKNLVQFYKNLLDN
jgi:glycosyltransferase involved in cell wall biosynthesis